MFKRFNDSNPPVHGRVLNAAVSHFYQRKSPNLRLCLRRKRLVWIMIKGTALILVSTMPIDQDIPTKGILRMFYSTAISTCIPLCTSQLSRTTALGSRRARWLPHFWLESCGRHDSFGPFIYLPHPDNTTRSLRLGQPLSETFSQMA